MLVDDAVSTVGTPNLDNRSFRLNFEVTAFIVDAEFAAGMERMFEAEFAHAEVVDRAASGKSRCGGAPRSSCPAWPRQCSGCGTALKNPRFGDDDRALEARMLRGEIRRCLRAGLERASGRVKDGPWDGSI